MCAYSSQQKAPEDDEITLGKTATDVGRAEHFLKDKGEEIPVDPFVEALQIVEFGQCRALLVFYKHVAFLHAVAPRLHRKENVSCLIHSESQPKRKYQELKTHLEKNVGNKWQ